MGSGKDGSLILEDSDLFDTSYTVHADVSVSTHDAVTPRPSMGEGATEIKHTCCDNPSSSSISMLFERSELIARVHWFGDGVDGSFGRRARGFTSEWVVTAVAPTQTAKLVVGWLRGARTN